MRLCKWAIAAAMCAGCFLILSARVRAQDVDASQGSWAYDEHCWQGYWVSGDVGYWLYHHVEDGHVTVHVTTDETYTLSGAPYGCADATWTGPHREFDQEIPAPAVDGIYAAISTGVGAEAGAMAAPGTAALVANAATTSFTTLMSGEVAVTSAFWIEAAAVLAGPVGVLALAAGGIA